MPRLFLLFQYIAICLISDAFVLITCDGCFVTLRHADYATPECRAILADIFAHLFSSLIYLRHMPFIYDAIDIVY